MQLGRQHKAPEHGLSMTMSPEESPVTVTENRRAVFCLHSSLDNHLEALQGALDGLLDAPGLTLVRLSPVYETTPASSPKHTASLTAVLVTETVLSSPLLLERAHSVQTAMHPTRAATRRPPTIQVELVTVDGETSDDPTLTLPHPHAHQRACVLLPWHDVDPTGQLPGHGLVADLLTAVADQDTHRRDDLPLRPPT